MADALLGHTGFVGSSLLRQRPFEACFNSGNIEQLAEGDYDTIVCAAAPAQKWLANQYPDADQHNIQQLMAALARARCKTFILISTVDVYVQPNGVDETVSATSHGLHPYGRHRLELEQFVRGHFANTVVVRLPGLVGPGLRKNVLHDLHHGHEVHKIDSRGCFQFYPMVNLWSDVQRVLACGLPLVHFSVQPLFVADIARDAFGMKGFDQVPDAGAVPARYDFRSVHHVQLGGRAGYLYDGREALGAIRAYAQCEPRRHG